MSHLNFGIFTNFWRIKIDLSGNTVGPKASILKLTIFGIFNELLSTQNVNVACFARNIECDFFGRFSNTVVLYFQHGTLIQSHVTPRDEEKYGKSFQTKESCKIHDVQLL